LGLGDRKMNKSLNYLYSSYDTRFPDKEEESSLIKYCNSLKFRLEVMKEVEQKEKAIISESVTFMMNKYPSLDENFNDVKYKTYRDLSLILRYCVLAMVRDDLDFLKNQLLYWLRTILKSFGFETGSLIDTYRKMDELCERELDPKAYKIMKPYLSSVIEIVNL